MLLLNKMARLHPNKLEWFAKKERLSTNNCTWKENFTYDQIIKHFHVNYEYPTKSRELFFHLLID